MDIEIRQLTWEIASEAAVPPAAVPQSPFPLFRFAQPGLSGSRLIKLNQGVFL
jgi:hypothetical protein